MFLWQKYNYRTYYIKNDEEFKNIRKIFNTVKPEYASFDTETTGLHIVKDKPFLIGFGFSKSLFVFEPSLWRLNELYDILNVPHFKFLLAHNTKFDYHMLRNYGAKIPDHIRLRDTYTMSRLTNYVDSGGSLALGKLFAEHIDKDSLFAETAIKTHLKQLNKVRLNEIKEYVKENNLPVSYTEIRKLMSSHVKYVDSEHYDLIEEVNRLYPEVNYEDSYKDKPNLMINYLFDDLLMVLDLYKKMAPVLDIVDKGRKTWNREGKLIPIYANMESQGMKLDIEYLLDSRKIVIDYMDKQYNKLWEMANIEGLILQRGFENVPKLVRDNKNFTVGQHQFIKEFYASKYRIGMMATDEGALTEILKHQNYSDEAKEVAKLILEIRTISKWLSTYIEGKLNKSYEGKLYTDIKISGTVTGRVSSDLQQEPSGSMYSVEGELLYNPRRAFINDDGFRNFYLDFSNMELRVQAFYTMLTSSGDINLCRAFIPFECTNYITGKKYNPVEDIDEWDSGEWVDENGDLWTKTDLHTLTATKAFPGHSPSDPDFKHYRDLGKRANFLKNYGGGLAALQSSMGIDYNTAQALDKGYYEAFPKVLDYQKWVEDNISNYGFVENLYGRRYYFNNSNLSYRGYNYLIQGSSADYLKDKQIELHELLKDTKSKMLMPIHDEMVYKIALGEEWLIPKIKKIMENSKSVIPLIPMLVDVEYAEHNWSDTASFNIKNTEVL